MNDSAAGGTGIEDPSLLDQQMLVDAFENEPHKPLEAEKAEKHPSMAPPGFGFIKAVFKPEVRVQLYQDGSMRLKWNWSGSLEPQVDANHVHETIVAEHIDLLNRQKHRGNKYGEVRATKKEVKW